jgi:hypothetical protein
LEVRVNFGPVTAMDISLADVRSGDINYEIKDKIMSPYPQKHQCGTSIICRQVYQSVKVVYWPTEKNDNYTKKVYYDTNEEFYVDYDCII